MKSNYLTGLLLVGGLVAACEWTYRRNNPTRTEELSADIASVLIQDSIAHDLPKLKEVLDNLVDFFESLGGRVHGIKYYADHGIDRPVVSKTVNRLTTAAEKLYGDLDAAPESVKASMVNAFFEEVIAFFEVYKGEN